MKMYSILLVLCMSSYSLSASSTLDGTCVNPTTLSFIENSLTNISDQLKGSSNGVSESITSVTSLLQLTMLKEMIGSYKESSTNNSNEEGLALLKRIELILNTSTADLNNKLENFTLDFNNKLDTSTAELSTRLSAIEQDIPSAISSLQSQVSSLSSDLKKIYQLLEEHVNVTGNYEEAPLLFSCDAILSKWPNSPSGYYNLADVNGHSRHVYCHMETLCGKGGGWRRIASLNMTDPNEKCPTQFRTYSEDGVRACGRPDTNSGSCVGITFPSKDIKYSQVCGKVIGYQVGSTDGAYAFRSSKVINLPYIDGISLTHGNPRKHIWSLISGYSGIAFSGCPCGSNNPKSVPSFVGSHYYCEAGNHNTAASYTTLYSSDPLWDGKGCGSTETTCCQRTLIPWFYRSFGYSTTDNIEMRLCCDQETSDENISFGQYEIYVK
uniref:Fibrinogen C-terminal domain-containing protein n=1 Tax=Amphimedon queenslandica TaxID=400682 RepID=A0A1X7UPJ1_AMPQE